MPNFPRSGPDGFRRDIRDEARSRGDREQPVDFRSLRDEASSRTGFSAGRRSVRDEANSRGTEGVPEGSAKGGRSIRDEARNRMLGTFRSGRGNIREEARLRGNGRESVIGREARERAPRSRISLEARQRELVGGVRNRLRDGDVLRGEAASRRAMDAFHLGPTSRMSLMEDYAVWRDTADYGPRRMYGAPVDTFLPGYREAMFERQRFVRYQMEAEARRYTWARNNMELARWQSRSRATARFAMGPYFDFDRAFRPYLSATDVAYRSHVNRNGADYISPSGNYSVLPMRGSGRQGMYRFAPPPAPAYGMDDGPFEDII